ncbi:hypothetical protein YDYSY3_25220 [Paenibacillus chitinolyticus]|nr:hypothetical protein YDYSY3_25220 [Paenibacillus chitinolyticus]
MKREDASVRKLNKGHKNPINDLYDSRTAPASMQGRPDRALHPEMCKIK